MSEIKNTADGWKKWVDLNRDSMSTVEWKGF
jgi:hypothetical protein